VSYPGLFSVPLLPLSTDSACFVLFAWVILRPWKQRQCVYQNECLGMHPCYTDRQHPPNKKFCEEIIAHFPWYDTGLHRKRRVQQLYFSCIFIAAVAFLPSRCLAAIGEWTYILKLMGGIYEVCRWNGLRCHDTHTEFHKGGSAIYKLIGVDTQTAWGSHEPILMFSE
jgi:hypothetical protein